jgi:hypothetical protein
MNTLPFSWLTESLLRRIGGVYLGIAALSLVALVLALLVKGRPAVKQPLLQIELAQSCRQVEEIVAKAGKGLIRGSLWSDFGIILIYGSALVLAGLLVAHRGTPGWIVLGIACAVCGVAAGLVDVRENLLTFSLLDACSSERLAALRVVTHWKWSLVAVSFLLASVLFFSSGSWRPVVGGLFVLAGVLGAWGIAKQPDLLEWALYLMVLSLLGFDLVLFFQPGKLLSPG